MTRNLPRTVLTVVLLASMTSCKAIIRELRPYLERDPENGMPLSKGYQDGSDLQTGEWTYYYKSSGMPRATGQYKDDHQVGEWVYRFDGTGTVERKGSYDERGRRTGEWLFQYPDGGLRSRGSYVEDAEEGPWEFRAQDGTLERAGQFESRLLSGFWVHHAGGKPSAEGLCHRGQRVGTWTLTDAGGNRSQYDFGLPPGVQVVLERWPNGNPRRAGVLLQGKATGRWSAWHETGSPEFLVGMKEGVPTGLFEHRDPNGTLLTAGSWIDSSERRTGPLATALAALLAPPKPAEAAPVTAPAPAADPVAVRTLEQAAERIPPAPQPDLSVTNKERIQSYVERYITGENPLSRTPVRRRTYGPGETPDTGSGPGRRSELETKTLPFQQLRAVDGEVVDLTQYRGKKNLLLVVLRGFSGEVCIYCVAQTEALDRCRAELQQNDFEVFVVYPGPRENEEAFEQLYRSTFGKSAPPYRVFYDPDLSIVRSLGIEGDLAAPTTLVVDRNGVVRCAYVSKNRAERPAVKTLMKEFAEMVGRVR